MLELAGCPKVQPHLQSLRSQIKILFARNDPNQDPGLISIALLKTSGKVGSLLGRATGVGGGVKEKVDARLDFRLFPVGSPTAVLTSSAAAKDESSEDASLSLAAGQEGRAVAVKVRKRK